MARTNLVSLATSSAATTARDQAARTREESEAALAEDSKAREDFAASGLPSDWLTSGIAGAGAGWLFGPVGGIAGLLIGKLLAKGRREGIAQQAAADAETASSLIDGGARALQRLESTAESDEEKLEVALLRDQYEQSVALAQNPDPSVATQGFSSLLALPGILEEEADEIEQSRLDAQQRDRDLLQTEVGNLNTLADDYRQESARFISQRQSFQEIQSAFDQPNGAGDIRGVYTFLKMLDPGSTIMPGELALAENTAGISESLRGSYNRLLEGESLTPIQRQQFTNEARESFENAQREQLQINTRFMDRGRAMQIRDPLLSTLTVTPDPLAAASYRTADPLGRETVNAVPEGAQVVNGDGMLTGIVDFWSQFAAEEVAAMDGSTYSYDQDGEQWYQTDVNGQTFKLPSAPPGFTATPQSAPQADPADTNFDGEVSFLEDMRDPARREQRNRDSRDRELLQPGLFQIGGVFGRDRTPEEEARRQELLNRQENERAVNE